MRLTHLSLTNFRAFSRLDMDVPGRILVLVGSNAQGKTSLLEAIYYLATASTVLAQSDRQLINFLVANEPLAVARMVADFEKGSQNHRLEVRLIQESGGNGSARLRKEILLDGVKKTAHEVVGQFTAVIFLPQMMKIMEGGPEERRRYLNLALSQAVPGYARAISEYSQVLTQRNALLKQLGERGGDPEQLTYWNELLTSRGAAIIHARISAIQELERLAARVHHRLTHAQEVLRLAYQPSFDPVAQPEGQYLLPMKSQVHRSGLSVEQIRQGFLQRLNELRGEEIGRGITTIGPHRDEMRVFSNGVDLGDFGSRGQARTALMSLKLAEVDWLKEKTGEWPVLLLDETLAELDPQRRLDLLACLDTCEQVALTTTDLHLFPDAFLSGSALWKVEAGRVEAMEN
jgi:DNA replication and repair protein RecF